MTKKILKKMRFKIYNNKKKNLKIQQNNKIQILKNKFLQMKNKK